MARATCHPSKGGDIRAPEPATRSATRSRFSCRLSIGAGLGLATLTMLLSGCTTQPKPQAAITPYPYDRPLQSIGALFVGLPPAVRNVVRAETGSAAIANIAKGSHSGRIVYIIYFENPEAFPPLYVSPEGSVLYPDLAVAIPAPREPGMVLPGSAVTGVKPAELPPNVLRVLKERAPNAEITYVNRESWGDRFVYIISFRDETHNPKLYVATDGTVLNQGIQ